ncbi:Pentatricopeptide repeat-containing protein [Apostasia shenzhenica]|uniref:Pentatricopeptide repeat-containing protein n=1 Tax=Apostasia shenzhenica TaxID=1088818 RepID=A0A2I0A1W5_9ASPA|nr:Pentatricopeptide repeat-containing protein [Apostasia shenzhenica]
MRALARFLRFLPTPFSTSFLLVPSAASSSFSPDTPPSPASAILTDAELAELRHLLPGLCDAGHPLDAVRLLDAALLTAPSLSALPLPDLADRLSSLPDMSGTMALLTALRYHPRRPSPLPFCSLFLSAYFRCRRLREAAKVFAWLCRADSPCRPDIEIYKTAILGFCERGMALEAVKVVREMVNDGMIPAEEFRILVCHSLLREARVTEAQELDSVIRTAGESDTGNRDGIDAVAKLLDRTIRSWEE